MPGTAFSSPLAAATSAFGRFFSGSAPCSRGSWGKSNHSLSIEAYVSAQHVIERSEDDLGSHLAEGAGHLVSCKLDTFPTRE